MDKTIICKTCDGTGEVICTNPDHGFIAMLSFHDIGRIGCPACGHSGMCICDECNGTGQQKINNG